VVDQNYTVIAAAPPMTLEQLKIRKLEKRIDMEKYPSGIETKVVKQRRFYF